MKMYLGIDPGKDGAIARMDCEGSRVDLVKFYDTPVMKAGTGGKREYDEAAMAEIIADLVYSARADGLEVFITIEKQFVMPLKGRERCPKCKLQPQPGAVGTFQKGYGYGIWVGVIAATQAPFMTVAPVTWKNRLLKDAPKEKDASRMIATRLFPLAASGLKRKMDHHRAEALLLAEYGRRVSGW